MLSEQGRAEVLDTHALIWYLEGSPRLGARARAVLSASESLLIVPAIALAEALFLVERGRTAIPSPTHLLTRVQEDERLIVAPLTTDVLTFYVIAAAIPEMHDRLIVSTALWYRTQGFAVTIVTRDVEIVNSGLIPTVW